MCAEMADQADLHPEKYVAVGQRMCWAEPDWQEEFSMSFFSLPFQGNARQDGSRRTLPRLYRECRIA